MFSLSFVISFVLVIIAIGNYWNMKKKLQPDYEEK